MWRCTVHKSLLRTPYPYLEFCPQCSANFSGCELRTRERTDGTGSSKLRPPQPVRSHRPRGSHAVAPALPGRRMRTRTQAADGPGTPAPRSEGRGRKHLCAARLLSDRLLQAAPRFSGFSSSLFLLQRHRIQPPCRTQKPTACEAPFPRTWRRASGCICAESSLKPPTASVT